MRQSGYPFTNQHGYPMRSDEMYEALGLDPRKHLPDEGVPPTQVQGITVYVLGKDQPSPSRRQKGRTPRQKRGWMIKRTFAVCPTCDRHVEAGHLHQHLRVHG